MRSWPTTIRAPVLVGMLAIVALPSCDADSPTASGGSGRPVDTTQVRFARFDYHGYVADGTVETGIELQWRIAFQSTARRWMRVTGYRLDRDGAVVLERSLFSPAVHPSGDTISGKETWIPINAPTPECGYRFRVQYQTGRRSINAVGDTLWTGLGSGSLDTTFQLTL
ncbi:MAG TPA: hypothetical protein VNN55_03230 [bacterium]|nr:hypothetical protein [bacterium]